MKAFIEKIALWLAKPSVQAHFNGWMTVVWLIMMCATPLFESLYAKVIWVSFISAWALFATHLGAWISALVNVKAERIDDRTEQNIHLAAIEAAEDRLLMRMNEVEQRTLERMEDQHKQMLTMLTELKGHPRKEA